jgi:hypothetical protein
MEAVLIVDRLPDMLALVVSVGFRVVLDVDIGILLLLMNPVPGV